MFKTSLGTYYNSYFYAERLEALQVARLAGRAPGTKIPLSVRMLPDGDFEVRRQDGRRPAWDGWRAVSFIPTQDGGHCQVFAQYHVAATVDAGWRATLVRSTVEDDVIWLAPPPPNSRNVRLVRPRGATHEPGELLVVYEGTAIARSVGVSPGDAAAVGDLAGIAAVA